MKFCKNINKWNITKEFIIQEYVNNKKSIPQIAEEIGMPYETLYWYKKKFGIKSYSPSFWHKGKRRSPNTEFKKGLAPWNKGKSWTKEDKKNLALIMKKVMERPEIRIKVKKTQFRKGTVPWNKGRSTGIIPWNKGKNNVYSNDTINLIRKARLKQIFPKKSTNAELILFEILNELNVKFSKHKSIKIICQADAFVEPNIVLFADGDYWHCNPKFYPKPKTKAQTKNFIRDKRANEKLIKDGYILGRFWEFDLINNKEQCKKIIKNLIKNG